MNRKFAKYVCDKCGGKLHSKKDVCTGCPATVEEPKKPKARKGKTYVPVSASAVATLE